MIRTASSRIARCSVALASWRKLSASLVFSLLLISLTLMIETGLLVIGQRQESREVVPGVLPKISPPTFLTFTKADAPISHAPHLRATHAHRLMTNEIPDGASFVLCCKFFAVPNMKHILIDNSSHNAEFLLSILKLWDVLRSFRPLHIVMEGIPSSNAVRWDNRLSWRDLTYPSIFQQPGFNMVSFHRSLPRVTEEHINTYIPRKKGYELSVLCSWSNIRTLTNVHVTQKPNSVESSKQCEHCVKEVFFRPSPSTLYSPRFWWIGTLVFFILALSADFAGIYCLDRDRPLLAVLCFISMLGCLFSALFHWWIDYFV